MKMLFNRLGKLSAAGVVVLIGLASCSEEKVAEAPVIRPVKVVEVKAPQQGASLTYSGAVRARTEIPMGFRVDGKVTQRLVDVGQRVKPGDVLARLDSTDYELSVRQAEAELASAEKQVEISQIALKRAQTLQQQNVTSQSQLEQAQLSSEQAIARRDAAASSLDQARNRVAYSVLKADLAGLVTAVSAEAGQVVAAGNPVVTIAQDGEKEAVIAVPEADISQFSPGKAVKASFWFDQQLVVDGKVREVAGSADAQSRTFAVRVSLPDDPHIRLGVTATVAALAETGAQSFELPLAALTKQDDKSAVWVVDPTTKKVTLRPVTIDGFTDNGVRVSSGIAAGDLVVAAGTQFMRPDLEVSLGSDAAQPQGQAGTVPSPANS
ncbi:efflux RND transporter periplasmic adaptor subunit [Rhizobium helianthi]|uniref:Efflux RND transporter periplasmic adaptor subunit n=1 Tax=Rhizobium helianthi TaxID=1132695 RepID=A0ABW4M5R7_9HYPH